MQPREDRRDDARAAQGERLADVGDAEAGRTALERGDGRAHGAVPVAVGLDDGDHLGVGEPAQVPDVAEIAPTSISGLAQDAGGEPAHARLPAAASAAGSPTRCAAPRTSSGRGVGGVHRPRR